MIIDQLNTLFKGENLYGAAGNLDPGSALDFGSGGGGRIFVGMPQMYFVFLVTTDVSGGDSTSTVQLALRTGAAVTTGDLSGTVTTLLTTKAYSLAELNAGPIVIPMPTLPDAYERYFQCRVIRVGTTTTAGVGSAYLVLDADLWQAYPDAVN